MARHLRAGRTDGASRAQGATGSTPPPRPGNPFLSTIGRPVPPLTPQTLGRYLSEAVGKWANDRTKLSASVIQNLWKLDDTQPGPEREQLHLEITLHWHCLSDAEKSIVLESLGTQGADLLGDTRRPVGPDQERTAVRDWLEHTLVFTKPEDATRLKDACSPEAMAKLETLFEAAGGDEALEAALKKRFAELRMTMPLDHMYDYSGFYWSNNRQVGQLPPGVAEKLRVCVVGAGPAGIMVADGLNRLGVKNLTVLEQADKIGGRIAAERWTEKGKFDPTPIHPGGMRFHTTDGNFYWSFAEHYGLQHVPFPNSSSVSTTYIIGNKVTEAEPGQPPSDPVMRKVAQDFERAMGALIDPIRAARDAGDTAKFRELCDAAKDKFDNHTFKSGLTLLLAEQGIKWSSEEWDTFGAVGIGVGGYQGYFGTGFLEEFRFLVDERLENHVGIVGGADLPLYEIVRDEEGLPEGQPSLAGRNAIQLNMEVTEIKKIDGEYHVSSLNKVTGETTTQVCDEIFFAGGPREAVRLGLTSPQEGSEPLMSEDFARALEKANVVGATKMAIKIARDLFEQPELLPGNVQSSKLFQQSYMVPDGNGGAVFYPSYTLGDNAMKVVGMSGEEQLDLYIATLRNVASREPENPTYQKLANLADVVEQSKGRYSYTHWSTEPHQLGAFKMDEPGDLDNTRTLFRALLQMSDDAIFVNEENTFEGGFASGALAAAVNGMQRMILRHGGTLPANSPFYQEFL